MYALYGTGTLLKGLTAADDFTITTTPRSVAVGGATVQSTDKDALINVTSGASVTVVSDITVSPAGSTATLATNTPAICSVSGGTVSPVGAGGAGSILVTVGDKGTRIQNVTTAASVSSVSVPYNYSAGSVAKHIYDTLQPLAAVDATASTASTARYSNAYNVGSCFAPSGTNSTTFWARSLDLSSVSFCRGNGGGTYWVYPATLVADGTANSSFAITATHTSLTTGDTVVFLKTNGAFVSAVVANYYDISGTDLRLVRFTAPVVGVSACKILPANWATYFPLKYAVPALFVGGHPKDTSWSSAVSVQWLVNPPTISQSQPSLFTSEVAAGTILSTFSPYSWPVIGGDSSGPFLWPISGQMVLGFCRWGPGNGPSVYANKATINTAMNNLASVSQGTYALQAIDLTVFAVIP